MKKLVLILIIFSALFIPELSRADLSQMELKTENSYLKLYMNNETTELAVQEKRSENIWYSNPQDLDEMEEIASGNRREAMESQLEIQIFNPASSYRNTNSHSIEYNQYDIKPINDGVQVDYIIGAQWKDDDYLPDLLSEEVFENAFLEGLAEDEHDTFLDNYELITLYEKEDTDKEEEFSVSGVNEEDVFGNYRVRIFDESLTSHDKEEIIYDFLQTVVGYIEDMESVNDLTPDRLSVFENENIYVKQDILGFVEDDLIDLSRNMGNEPSQFTEMFQNYMLDPPAEAVDIYHVSVQYIIDGKDFKVRIPAEKIQYPENLEDEERDYFPLSRINVLPFFGAANKNEEGFIFVPDGSGALIELNNDRLYAQAYRKRIFGWDNANFRRTMRNHPEKIHLPVYGLKNSDGAFLAIIEEGQALARIYADIAGRTNSYNTVYPEFTLRNYTTMDLGDHVDGSRMHVFQREQYVGDLQIRYSFISGKDTGYAEMANYYQEYLKEKYDLTKIDESTGSSLYLELVGAISRVEQVYGIPRETAVPLTSYQQGEKIIQHLLDENITNLKVRYLGWLKGGKEHYYPEQAILEKELGNSEQMAYFSKFLADNNIPFYPHVDFLHVHQSRILDGFSVRQDSSRTLDRRTARKYDYHPGTFALINDKFSYVLSPSRLNSVITGFLNNWGNPAANALSVDLGSYINSDNRLDVDRFMNRQQSLKIIEGELNRISTEHNMDLMVEEAHSPALGVSENILYTPPTSTEYNIIDRSVPFYQIALSGYYNYTLEPINLAVEYDENILRTLETGASLHYKIFYEDNSEVIETDFDHLYSANFADWASDIKENHKNLSPVLNKINNQKIIDHRRLKENVFQTNYENGYKIIVNYNQNEVKIEGDVIEGSDFLLRKDDH